MSGFEWVADEESLADVVTSMGQADRYAIDTEFDLTAATRHTPVVSLDTPIVVVCGSVRGSGPVAAELRAKGFTNVVHVEGGFPAWKDAGLPTEAPVG